MNIIELFYLLLRTRKCNSQNLLERVNQSDGMEIAYQYDGFGHRIAKKNSRSDDFFKRDVHVTEFVVDYTRANHNVIGESSDSDSFKRERIFISE